MIGVNFMQNISITSKACNLCPRNCASLRTDNHIGRCGMSWELKAARASLHFWEEPCISGTKGSGTVFFSGCPLGCVYCQNREIALGLAGKVISETRLSEIFLELQNKGANNINLVTPTHYILSIKKALITAKQNGLTIPIVYNTSGYELVESLQLLDGLIDIYLPDLKYYSSEVSTRYSKASDYFSYASSAIKEMFRQVGTPIFHKDSSQDLMTRGMIVRHLVLPGQIKDSKNVIRYLYETYGDQIYISILNQYTPPTENLSLYPELCRILTEEEYDEIVDYAIDLGIENGFIQEGETAKESFIPAFDYEGL